MTERTIGSKRGRSSPFKDSNSHAADDASNTEEYRRQRRLQRNRKSAALHRERQKALTDGLIGRVAALTVERDILRQELERVTVQHGIPVYVPPAAKLPALVPQADLDSGISPDGEGSGSALTEKINQLKRELAAIQPQLLTVPKSFSYEKEPEDDVIGPLPHFDRARPGKSGSVYTGSDASSLASTDVEQSHKSISGSDQSEHASSDDECAESDNDANNVQDLTHNVRTNYFGEEASSPPNMNHNTSVESLKFSPSTFEAAPSVQSSSFELNNDFNVRTDQLGASTWFDDTMPTESVTSPNILEYDFDFGENDSIGLPAGFDSSQDLFESDACGSCSPATKRGRLCSSSDSLTNDLSNVASSSHVRQDSHGPSIVAMSNKWSTRAATLSILGLVALTAFAGFHHDFSTNSPKPLSLPGSTNSLGPRRLLATSALSSSVSNLAHAARAFQGVDLRNLSLSMPSRRASLRSHPSVRSSNSRLRGGNIENTTSTDSGTVVNSSEKLPHLDLDEAHQTAFLSGALHGQYAANKFYDFLGEHWNFEHELPADNSLLGIFANDPLHSDIFKDNMVDVHSLKLYADAALWSYSSELLAKARESELFGDTELLRKALVPSSYGIRSCKHGTSNEMDQIRTKVSSELVRSHSSHAPAAQCQQQSKQFENRALIPVQFRERLLQLARDSCETVSEDVENPYVLKVLVSPRGNESYILVESTEDDSSGSREPQDETGKRFVELTCAVSKARYTYIS